MVRDKRQFFLTLEKAEDFKDIFERDGTEVGRFFPSSHNLRVGERVSLVVTVKGLDISVFLEGKIVWRRTRPGGAKIPAGVFVGLVERDRARLEGISKYLKAPSERERRSFKRYPVSMEATYSTAKGEFSSKVSNLSQGGAFLRCMGPLLTVGARFPLILHLDQEGEKGKRLSIEVRVAWIDYFEETQGMGVIFEGGQFQLRKIKRLVGGFEKELKKSKAHLR